MKAGLMKNNRSLSDLCVLRGEKFYITGAKNA